MTDVENVLSMVKDISSREKRNRVLSVDPELIDRRRNRSTRDEDASKTKPNTRKNIKTNLELLKGSIKVNPSKANKEESRNAQRNTTPMKSKEDAINNKSFKDQKATDRLNRRNSKSKKNNDKEETKYEQTNRSTVIKNYKETQFKCGECGDDGFKDIKELTKHQHKYCKAFRRCNNCEKLLKASEYDLHISKKCRKKTTIKNSENK